RQSRYTHTHTHTQRERERERERERAQRGKHNQAMHIKICERTSQIDTILVGSRAHVVIRRASERAHALRRPQLAGDGGGAAAGARGGGGAWRGRCAADGDGIGVGGQIAGARRDAGQTGRVHGRKQGPLHHQVALLSAGGTHPCSVYIPVRSKCSESDIRGVGEQSTNKGTYPALAGGEAREGRRPRDPPAPRSATGPVL
ncbi:hypothetical protein GOP47_0022118, partial [Adiantum capillus-veneris]